MTADAAPGATGAPQDGTNQNGQEGPRLEDMPRLNLTGKIAFTIFSILAASLVLTALLNYFRFERTLSSIVRSRVEFGVVEMKETLEDGMNLGVALNALRNTQALIERERSLDPDILEIAVYDEAGAAVYSTRDGAEGSAAPVAWQRYLLNLDLKTQDAPTAFEEPDEMIVVAPLGNSFDKLVGSIALHYSKRYLTERTDEMMGNLARVTAGLFALFSLFALIAVIYLSRSSLRTLRSMKRSLDDLLAGRERGQSEDRDELGQFGAFTSKTREVMTSLEAARTEMDRLIG